MEVTLEAFDHAGNRYVADTSNRTIRKVAIGAGQVTTGAGSPDVTNPCAPVDGVGATARFCHVDGIAIDRAGNLYAAEDDSHVVRKLVLSTGEVTTLARNTSNVRRVRRGSPATLNNPQAIVSLDDGRLLFSDEQSILAIE